jgi:seryl-tRNA synthetase
MHNLKEIRKDFNTFKKSLEKRSIDIDLSKIEDLDKKNRELIQEKETLEKEKKEISKSKDKSLFEKSKEISSNLEKIIEQQKKVKENLDNLLSNIPNIPHNDVPLGKDEVSLILILNLTMNLEKI